MTLGRPAVLGLLVTICCAAAPHADPGADIAFQQPRLSNTHAVIDFGLSGILDEAIRPALESGLPATLSVEWRLRRHRSGWWDAQLDAGQILHRVLFDVLEERFDLFDERGRRVTTCHTLEDVRTALGGVWTIVIPNASRLKKHHRYYIDAEARLDILNLEEIRDLEQWLGGDPTEEGTRSLLSTLSDQAMELLKNIVGPEGRSARGRSPLFHGWF